MLKIATYMSNKLVWTNGRSMWSGLLISCGHKLCTFPASEPIWVWLVAFLTSGPPHLPQGP